MRRVPAKVGQSCFSKKQYKHFMFLHTRPKANQLKPQYSRHGQTSTKSHTQRPSEGETDPVQSSDQIGDVHRHLVDLRAVVLLNVPQDTDVILAHKVDRHTLQSWHTENFHASQEEAAFGMQRITILLRLVKPCIFTFDKNFKTK